MTWCKVLIEANTLLLTIPTEDITYRIYLLQTEDSLKFSRGEITGFSGRLLNTQIVIDRPSRKVVIDSIIPYIT